jgi:primosomal protein N' (replication factor Y)
MKAPDTDTWLVEHRYTGRLVCHVTGFSIPKPKKCPTCGAADSLHAVGPGVERLEEEARATFPDARIEVFSSDTASDPAEVRARIEAMASGKIDILIGTQIVAKGHNFPNLTLVGVVDADLGLKGGDLRAGEKTYQILVQVAGRAGRADKPGRAMLQTCQPDHEALVALCGGDRDGFLAIEIEGRRAASLPPYGRLAALHLSGPDEEKLERIAREAGRLAPIADDVDVMGPAEPPISVVRGRWRRRFLVRTDLGVDISAYMAAWRDRLKIPGAIRLSIDIEPYSFL